MANKLIDVNGLKAFWNKLKAYTATTSRNGLMSSTDKEKVDDIFPSRSDMYARISKYIAKAGSNITTIEAYPLMRVDADTIMFCMKVTASKPCIVVVYVIGVYHNFIEMPTISINNENVASFTIMLPLSAAYTQYKKLIINTEEI